MGIADRILNTLGLSRTSQFTAMVTEAAKRELDKVHPWLGETADAQRWEIPDPIIYANQSDLYRLSPILGTALDILADDVGLSKFNVKRMVGEDERDIPNHEFELLLRTPNPLDSGLEFMRDTTMSYKLNGNAIWWINRSGWYDKPDELWPIPYEMIQPVPDGRLYLSHYNYFPGNGKLPIPLATWEIAHFKTYNPHNRFVGLSPIESLAMTITGNLGMRRTKTRQYTEYGGAPQSILAFKDWVNNEAWKDIKTEARTASLKNEMMMLRGVGDGVTWMARAMSNKDAEFIENLQSDMRDVFNRMAPGLLAMLDANATEANALAARATYSEKALWKTLEAFAQKITADILPVYGRKLIGEFDDPRVVDRSLEMKEQELYAKTHTIDQVNAKYYQEDPLGDERGDLLVSEIRTRNAFGNTDTQDESQSATVETDEDTGDEETATKAAIDDMKRWRTIALRGKTGKAESYISQYIPGELMKSVKARLPELSTRDEIATYFDGQIEKLKPVPKVNPLHLLQGIEAGVKALELSRKE